VFSIVEDREGHLWLGTNLGLTRYDGQKFARVETDGQCGFLWGRCVDSEGKLWFGLDRRPGRPAAVCCWDGTRLALADVSDTVQPQGESIHRVVCDHEGALWAGGDGLYRSDDGRRFVRLPLPWSVPCEIQDLLPRGDGCLWIATENELWALDAGQFELLLTDQRGAGACFPGAVALRNLLDGHLRWQGDVPWARWIRRQEEAEFSPARRVLHGPRGSSLGWHVWDGTLLL